MQQSLQPVEFGLADVCGSQISEVGLDKQSGFSKVEEHPVFETTAVG